MIRIKLLVVLLAIRGVIGILEGVDCAKIIKRFEYVQGDILL